MFSVSCCLFLSDWRSAQSQKSLSGLFWKTARDLSATGDPKDIWGGWAWLGIPLPDCLSQNGIRPRCVLICLHMCFTPRWLHGGVKHTDLFTPPWKKPNPGGRADSLEANSTNPPCGYFNCFTWITFTATHCIIGASGQKSIALISLDPDSLLNCEKPIALNCYRGHCTEFDPHNEIARDKYDSSVRVWPAIIISVSVRGGGG